MKGGVCRELKVHFDFDPPSRYHGGPSARTHARTHAVYVNAEPPCARGERHKCVFSVSCEETYKSRQSHDGSEGRRANSEISLGRCHDAIYRQENGK